MRKSKSASMGSLFHSLAISERRLPCMRQQLGFCTAPIMMASGPGISCHSLSQSFDGVSMSLRIRARVAGSLQTLDQLGGAAIVRPGRNEGGEIVEPGGVGVGVGSDVGSGGAGGVDFGDDFRHASPVVFAGDLDVPDLDGDVGFAADAQGFVDGLENGVALVAHVRGVDAAELSRLRWRARSTPPSWRRERARIGARWRRPTAPSFMASRTSACICVELLGSRLLVVVAQHHAADLRGADIAGEVDAHALLFEAREILAEGAPVGSDLVVIVAGRGPDWMMRVVERSDRSCLRQ